MSDFVAFGFSVVITLVIGTCIIRDSAKRNEWHPLPPIPQDNDKGGGEMNEEEMKAEVKKAINEVDALISLVLPGSSAISSAWRLIKVYIMGIENKLTNQDKEPSK